MAKKKSNSVIEINGKMFTLTERIETNTKVREIPYRLKDYAEEVESGRICRDVLIQRTDDQWTRKQKSRLIESVLADRPIGGILIARGRSESQNYMVDSLIDGLQRTTAMVDFVHNRFSLDKKVKPIVCRFVSDDGEVIEHAFDVAGRKFNQLPEAIQNFILEYRLMVYRYEGFSDDELDDVVYCVNNGKTPTSYQKIRFLLGSENMRLIQPICDSTLWEDNKSCKAKNDSILSCVVRSLMMLTKGDFVNLGAASMASFVDSDNFDDSVKTSDIKELANLVEQLAEIKYDMTDDELEYLNACSIPHLLIALKRFNETDNNADNETFLDILRAFWNSSEYESYEEYCSSGSGASQYSAESVGSRQRIIDDFLKKGADCKEESCESETFSCNLNGESVDKSERNVNYTQRREQNVESA